ncbi:MAG TPA: TRAP transporter substrate-binding protein DctP [Kofleriaceae bacterium]|nr:TRAP transporter substrate-binding protein DctP [Kofleriaceae bacterium]
MSKLVKLVSIAALAAVASPASLAFGDNTELRIATLAPSGSPWMEVLGKGQAEINTKTAGRLTVKYYEGGQQGDERDFVRKMGLGQLDGAAITSVGLAMVDESIRVLELPRMFASVEELDAVADKMWPYFQKKFEKKGYKLADRGEVGWIYVMSKSKVDSVATLKSQKMWLWGDDQIFSALYKKLGLNGVPLGVPEVDAGLTSGKINGCYGSPVAAVALQWYSKVKYMTSMPMSFAIGATVIKMDSLKKASAEDQKAFDTIGKATQKKLRKVIRKANADAQLTMTKKGVTVVETPAAMVAEFDKAAQEVWKDLAGKVYSKEELDMVIKYRDEFRAKKKK